MSPQRGQAVPTSGVSQIPLLFLIPGLVGPVATDILSGWLRVTGTFRLGAAHLTAKTAPSGSLSFTILRSTNGGSTFASILSGVLTLPPSAHTADLTPTWAVTQLNDGDLLRVDITTADSGNLARDVMIEIVPIQ